MSLKFALEIPLVQFILHLMGRVVDETASKVLLLTSLEVFTVSQFSSSKFKLRN